MKKFILFLQTLILILSLSSNGFAQIKHEEQCLKVLNNPLIAPEFVELLEDKINITESQVEGWLSSKQLSQQERRILTLSLEKNLPSSQTLKQFKELQIDEVPCSQAQFLIAGTPSLEKKDSLNWSTIELSPGTNRTDEPSLSLTSSEKTLLNG